MIYRMRTLMRSASGGALWRLLVPLSMAWWVVELNQGAVPSPVTTTPMRCSTHGPLVFSGFSAFPKLSPALILHKVLCCWAQPQLPCVFHNGMLWNAVWDMPASNARQVFRDEMITSTVTCITIAVALHLLLPVQRTVCAGTAPAMQGHW
jgi:hypothetical protein